MSDDLDTLLRDAGREPTIDLDVAAVHAAGRRRTTIRRAAAGAGALALVSVLAVGVTSLMPDAVIPPIDPIGTPTQGGALPTSVPSGTLSPIALTGDEQDVVVITLDGTAYVGDRTRSDGSVSAAGFPGGEALLSRPMVAADGSVWALEADGELVRSIDGTARDTVIAPDSTVAWMPLAAGGTGAELLVMPINIGGVDRALPPTVMLAQADGSVEALVGFDLGAVLDAGDIVPAASLDNEELLIHVLREDGRNQVLLLQAGNPPASTVELAAQSVPAGEFVSEVMRVSGSSFVVLRPTDGGAFGGTTPWRLVTIANGVIDRSVPLPDADQDVGVTGTSRSPRSAVAVLNRSDPSGVAHPALVVDLLAVASGEGAPIRTMNQPGIVGFADPSLAPVAVAPCADDPDRLNQPANVEITLWFECGDATALLADGVAFPFYGVERFQAASLAVNDPSGIRAILDEWARGPSDDEVALGLSGGLPAETATIGGIAIDGRTVTVDIISGESIGILGTTHAGASFTYQLVGAILQLDSFYDDVIITLDGSCEAWSVFGEGDPDVCRSYDATSTPWQQHAGA